MKKDFGARFGIGQRGRISTFGSDRKLMRRLELSLKNKDLIPELTGRRSVMAAEGQIVMNLINIGGFTVCWRRFGDDKARSTY